jgi:hypothetical protein
MRVRIKKVPQARTGYQVQGSLANDVPAMGGADYNTYIGKPKMSVSKYITAVPREEANLEAEGGETVYGDINGDGIPEHKIIKGPRHSGGGVPLNLPDDTFIYSDFRGMNIKDPVLLAHFGKGSKGKKSFTPAQLAKQYDIDKYRKILQDPNSDNIDIRTAELMIGNYNKKLAALALVQESQKGFPQGIPAVAKPYMAENKHDESTFINPEIKQFGNQVSQKLAQSEQQNVEETDESNTEFQDNEAQEMNQGQPVAMPEQQYGGMFIGGFDFPYSDDIPEAEYGMAMGANPRNYMGRPKSPMYARGGALRTYQGDEGASSTGATGGASPAGDVLDITGMDDEQAIKAHYAWKRKNPNKEPSIMKGGKKMNYKAPDPQKTVGLNDLKAVNAVGQKFLETELKNPDSKVRAEFLKEAKAAYDDPATGGSIGISKYRKGKKSLSDDEIINGILSGKKRNDAIKEAGIDMAYLDNGANGFATFDDLKKRGLVKDQAEYDKIKADYKAKGWDSKDKIAKTLNIKLPTPQETLAEQAGAHGFARMQKNKVAGTYNSFDDDSLYAMDTILGKEHSRETNTGGADETEMAKLYGAEYASLSPIEGYAGNSALAHGINPNMDRGKFEEAPGTETKTETTTDTTTEDDTTEDEQEQQEVEERNPEMWLQDKLNIGNAAIDFFSAKKYMPMGAARVDLQNQKPTFMDPTRELAANAEQANIQTAGMAQFAGPQALSARSSSIQGQGAKNAADVLARYNNQNVGIANQFEAANTAINNQEAAINQANQLKLYDQNTIANQQFDNTKRALKNNLLNQTNAGITNMYKTDALNQMYPEYQVNTGVGGRVTFDPTKARQIKPEVSGNSEQKFYTECSNMYKEEAQIQKCVESKKKAAGSTGTTTSGLEAHNAHSKVGTTGTPPEAKHGGFIYGDITYPFIL